MDCKDIDAIKACELFLLDPRSVLVDVRTKEEWDNSREAINFFGSRIALISWKTLPEMKINPSFIEVLDRTVQKDQAILFVCRSGVRSSEAGTYSAGLGFDKCYNLICGFEDFYNYFLNLPR